MRENQTLELELFHAYKRGFLAGNSYIKRVDAMETTTTFTDTQKSVDDFAGETLIKEKALAMMAKHNVTLPRQTPD